MNEEDATAKVNELMINLDEVKKYKQLALSTWRCVKYLLLATVTFLSIEIVYAFSGYFYGYYTNWFITMIGGINALFFLIGLLVIAIYEDRKSTHYRPSDWSIHLTGGFPSALKLLSDYDWESIQQDIKYAKMGLLMAVIGNVAIATILISTLIGVFSLFILSFTIHVQLDLSIIVLISIPLAIILFWKNIDRRMRAVWGMDYLASDLRWLYSELRGVEFEA